MALPGLIVKKVGMTRMVDPEGRLIPVTLVVADKQQVTKVLDLERDGYHGVQVGFYNKPEHRLNKPDLHRLRKAKIENNFARFKEIRLQEPSEELQLGTELTVGGFEDVVSVDVTGVTKGRGFQGATRRWNSATGRRTHGSRYHRRPGSLGQCTSPGRCFKNRKMPGQMGNVQSTVKNLKVLDVDKENNVIAIRGSVPGHREGYLFLRPSDKGIVKKEKK